MSSATAKKIHSQWTPVKGHQGFFKKMATPPNLADPDIRRTLEELNEQFKAIEEASNQMASEKFHLYGFARK